MDYSRLSLGRFDKGRLKTERYFSDDLAFQTLEFSPPHPYILPSFYTYQQPLLS